MASYHGPKLRLSRGLEVPIAETPKHVTTKRQKRPGCHGYQIGSHRQRKWLQLVSKRLKMRIDINSCDEF